MKKIKTEQRRLISHDEVNNVRYLLGHDIQKESLVHKCLSEAYSNTGHLNFEVDVFYIDTTKPATKEILDTMYLSEIYLNLKKYNQNEFIVTVTSWTDEN